MSQLGLTFRTVFRMETAESAIELSPEINRESPDHVFPHFPLAQLCLVISCRIVDHGFTMILTNAIFSNIELMTLFSYLQRINQL